MIYMSMIDTEHFHVFPRYKGDGFGWTFGDNVCNSNQELADEIRKLLSDYS